MTMSQPIVQERLFGGYGAAERFEVEETTGAIVRWVSRKDVDALPVRTVVGVWDRRTPLSDIRAAADLAFLQMHEWPSAPHGGEDVRVVDLFSGCGAMSLGVAEACRALGKRFVAAGACDIEARVLDIYARNFGEGTTTAADLSEVLCSDLSAEPTPAEAQFVERFGIADFLIAGPPCQGNSNLNNKTRRNDPKNALYFLVARAAMLLKPKWIIIENVIGVLHDKGQVVNRTREALEELGYTTSEGIVDLWTIGVPQTRRRHIMIAQLGLNPALGGLVPHIQDYIAPYITRQRSVGWAIDDLLSASTDHFMDRVKTPDDVTQHRIEYLFDHNLYDLPDSQRPDCHKPGNHSYGSVYGRMRWEEPAPTLTGGFDTMGQGRFVHPKRRRTITAHEAARLQFIPDFYDFSRLREFRKALVMTIGNAVPPKLSYVLALELMR